MRAHTHYAIHTHTHYTRNTRTCVGECDESVMEQSQLKFIIPPFVLACPPDHTAGSPPSTAGNDSTHLMAPLWCPLALRDSHARLHTFTWKSALPVGLVARFFFWLFCSQSMTDPGNQSDTPRE